jgi:hypothetical protein
VAELRPETYWPGGLDPVLLEIGGDLPPLVPGEVEIARVEVATGEVVSVRARRDEHYIRYSVVDEFGEEGSEYEPPLDASVEPLTEDELVELIDGTIQRWHGVDTFTGLVSGLRAQYAEDVAEDEVAALVRVRSAFYPGIGARYR